MTTFGPEIVFEHRKRGYDVYRVGIPCKEREIMPPTGFPKLILFKDNTARIVVGDDSFDWI